MEQEAKVKIVKELIQEGKLVEFKDIFGYVHKKHIHTKTGMNYYRLLRVVKNPKLIKFEDIYSIARVLQVPARAISSLIHNQIESKKKR